MKTAFVGLLPRSRNNITSAHWITTGGIVSFDGLPIKHKFKSKAQGTYTIGDNYRSLMFNNYLNIISVYINKILQKVNFQNLITT